MVHKPICDVLAVHISMLWGWGYSSFFGLGSGSSRGEHTQSLFRRTS